MKKKSHAAGNTTLLLAATLLTALISPAQAQVTDINGVASDGSPTDAIFSTSLSVDNSVTFNTAATEDDDVIITGTITPDTDDVGKTADIFVIDKVGDAIMIRNTDGNYEPLAGGLAGLVPALENRVLTDEFMVEVFEGKLSDTGQHKIYLGYQVTGSSVLVYSPKATKFEVIGNGDIISGPEEAILNEEISFQLNSSLVKDGVTYTWDFADGTSTDTGTSVNHTFSEPNRYMLRVSRSDSADTYYHYLNVGRAYENTAFPLYTDNALAPVMINRDFAWNDCDPDWEVYDGKYNRLWLESTVADQIGDISVIRFLAYADFLFDSYSSIIGWEFGHKNQVLDTYICDDIPGGGTGTGGSFYGAEVLTDLNQIPDVRFSDFGYLPHEMLHLWDFRGGTWMNSQDTAHAFTSGMEPILANILKIGWNMSAIIGEKNVRELDPDYIFNMYFHIALTRYLSHPELDWYTYNSDEFLNLAYEDLPLPENKEHMLVPGGLLMSLYNMHGQDGLRKLFAELEKIMLANPDWADPEVGYKSQDKFQRVQTFEDAMANALELDVSDYFDYWKYPAVDDSVTSKYPKSDKIIDHDGDGFSPLQGDRDDGDATVYPYAPELADGKDNNQDGLVDEHVYSENTDGVSYMDVELPFFLEGTLNSLNDEDDFSFTMPQSGWVVLNVYAKDSDTSVAYDMDSDKLVSVMQAGLRMEADPVFPVILPFLTAPHVFGAWYLEAGPHLLSLSTTLFKGIDADTRNPNPGNYEIQMFINDYEPVNNVETLLDVVYPGKYTPPVIDDGTGTVGGSSDGS